MVVGGEGTLIRSVLGLTALRWSTVILFVVIWNLFQWLANYLNGGWGRYEERSSSFVLALCGIAASLFFFSVVMSSRFRETATAERRRARYHPAPFVFLGAITGLLGLVSLAAALGVVELA